jgi:hypothetical protein
MRALLLKVISFVSVIILIFFVLLSNSTNTNIEQKYNNTDDNASKTVTRGNDENISSKVAPCVLSGPDTCDFQVRIYDELFGGSLLFSETLTDIEIGDTNGLFDLMLNTTCAGGWTSSAAPCSDNGINWEVDPTLYIEVEFDPSGKSTFSGAEVFKRIRLRSIPYANYANRAGEVVGGLDTVYANDSDKILNVNHPSGLKFASSAGNISFDIKNGGNFIVLSGSLPVLSVDSSGAINFNNSNTKNIRIETSSIAPNCSLATIGRSYYNTTNKKAYVCVESAPSVFDWYDYTPSPASVTNKIISVVNPTSSDDITQGIVVGTIWINSLTNAAYIATNTNSGAAIWEQIDLTPPITDLDDAYTNDTEKIININNLAGLQFVSSTAGDLKFELQSTGDLVFNAQSTDAFIFNNNGGLEILLNGLTNPNVNIENQGSSTALVVNETGALTPDLLDLQVSSLSRFKITNDGRIEANINGVTKAFDIIYNTGLLTPNVITISNLGAGQITTAIDISDANIINAIDLGQNNIVMSDSGTFSINNTSSNQVMQVTDIAPNFGGAIESGAFISRNSYFGEEWSRYRPGITIVTSQNAVWGDIQSFSLVEQANNTNDCLFEVVANGIGGIGRIVNQDPNTTCIAFIGVSATVGHFTYNAANLPLFMTKVRPSSIAAGNIARVGLSGTTTATDAEHVNGIYFTSNSGVWTGVTRSAAVSTNVVCTGQTVSTTQFASLKIETRSLTDVRFYVDNDMSDGLQWFECGSSSTNIPLSSLTSMIKWTATATNEFLMIDHMRIWQDDAPISNANFQNSTEDLMVYDDLYTAMTIDLEATEPEYMSETSEFENYNPDSLSQPISMPIADVVFPKSVDQNPLNFVQSEGTISISPSLIDISQIVFVADTVQFNSDVLVQGSVSIDGDLNLARNLNLSGNIVLSKNSFVVLNLPQGDREVFYQFTNEFDYPPFVYATQISGSPVSFVITDITKLGFRLRIEEEAIDNKTFELMILKRNYDPTLY